MLQENAACFGDAQRVLVGPVAAGDDEFAHSAVEMTAPVGHDTVGANGRCMVQVTAFAAVSDDGVIRNALGQWQLVKRGDEAVFGIEEVDAVWHLRRLFTVDSGLDQGECFGVIL